MSQRDRLSTVLVGRNDGGNLSSDIASCREAVRLFYHGPVDDGSILKNVLKVDKTAVEAMLDHVVQIMDMNDSLLMCFSSFLRKEETKGNILGHFSGDVVTLCRSQTMILVGVLRSQIFILIINELEDRLIDSLRITNHLSYLTVTNVFLSNLLIIRLHKKVFNQILNGFY